MSDEKDRMGDKLRDVEKARESQWAHDHDEDLLQKLRERLALREHMVSQDLKLIDEHRETRASNRAACPKCGKALIEHSDNGLTRLECPSNDGAWIDRPALDAIIHKPR
jgi:hypothetical protein